MNLENKTKRNKRSKKCNKKYVGRLKLAVDVLKDRRETRQKQGAGAVQKLKFFDSFLRFRCDV